MRSQLLHGEVDADLAQRTSSRHGPSKPNPGMRTMITSGFSSRRRPERSPRCSTTPRGEVLDAVESGEVDREVTLVEVGGLPDAAAVVGVVAVLQQRAREPEAVGTLDRLDLDHVGAEGTQVHPGVRPGPQRAQIDDPQPGERQVVPNPSRRFARRFGASRPGESAPNPPRGDSPVDSARGDQLGWVCPPTWGAGVGGAAGVRLGRHGGPGSGQPASGSATKEDRDVGRE